MEQYVKQVRTHVVCADFEGLVTPHDEPDFLGLLVTEQADFPGTSLLPFLRATIEPEELGAPACVIDDCE